MIGWLLQRVPRAKPANYGNAWYNPRIDRAFGRQPLAFEPNVGQTDAEVEFVTRGPGYQLFLTATEAVMVLRSPADNDGADFRTGWGGRQGAAAMWDGFGF